MDHYSILDQSSAAAVAEGALPASTASPSATRSVSAGIAAANKLLPNPAEPGARFPGEDSGRSLAAMASRDLDAALQLLAERAQYITGASGAAIALRRGTHHDMLCRACIGSNAPELGALLSMEYGLSGESVRTRQVLRCDDADHDPRVNRGVCHELGIASVVVLPIVSEEQVLGVFEVLSGKPRAFGERDLSALQRLGEMVEIAVRHSAAAQEMPAVPEIAPVESQPQPPQSISRESVSTPPQPPQTALPQPASPQPPQQSAPPVPKRPLFWSAAMRAQGTAPPKKEANTIAVPPVLRRLQKCQACGFPVSQGRAFCVECEERQWRGQRLTQPIPSPRPENPGQQHKDAALRDLMAKFVQDSSPTRALLTEPATANSSTIAAVAESGEPQLASLPSPSPTIAEPVAPPALSLTEPSPDVSASDNSTPFLTATMQSESWFAANKYILAALLAVTITIAAIALLH
jgi:GAF domain-containing protein